MENATVDIPDCMIQEEIDDLVRDTEMRMSYQGLKLENFIKYTGQTMEQIRENYKKRAEHRVRSRLVLSAIRSAEGIEATEEEIEAEVASQAEQMGKTVEELKGMLGGREKEYFGDSIAMKKTIQLLKDNAVSQDDVLEGEVEDTVEDTVEDAQE